MSTATRVIPTQLTVREIAALIDHSLLRPELTDDDVRRGCALADRYNTWSVCVRPADVALAARLLASTSVAVGTVVGFPHGHSTTESKLFETRRALDDGAREIDMVINIGALRGGKHDYVEDEIAAGSANVPAPSSSRPRPALPPEVRRFTTCCSWSGPRLRKYRSKPQAEFARWTGCSSSSPSESRDSAPPRQLPSWTRRHSAVPTAQPSPFRPHTTTKALPTLRPTELTDLKRSEPSGALEVRSRR